MGSVTLEKVSKHTRGVLLSKIGGVPLTEFERDFRSLLGMRFPFRELGFSDMRSCLESMTDTVRFEYCEPLQKLMLFGIADHHSFMSSPAIKAQFTPDKPIGERNRRKNRKFSSKISSDSDDSSTRKWQSNNRTKPSASSTKPERNPLPNGASFDLKPELKPNLKGLYSVCVTNQRPEIEGDILQLFSEAASPEESARSQAHFFLRYRSQEDAEYVIARFNGCLVRGSVLSVAPARERVDSTNRGKGRRANPKPHLTKQREMNKSSNPSGSWDTQMKQDLKASCAEEDSSSHLASKATPRSSKETMGKSWTVNQNGRTERKENTSPSNRKNNKSPGRSTPEKREEAAARQDGEGRGDSAKTLALRKVSTPDLPNEELQGGWGDATEEAEDYWDEDSSSHLASKATPRSSKETMGKSWTVKQNGRTERKENTSPSNRKNKKSPGRSTPEKREEAAARQDGEGRVDSAKTPALRKVSTPDLPNEELQGGWGDATEEAEDYWDEDPLPNGKVHHWGSSNGRLESGAREQCSLAASGAGSGKQVIIKSSLPSILDITDKIRAAKI